MGASPQGRWATQPNRNRAQALLSLSRLVPAVPRTAQQPVGAGLGAQLMLPARAATSPRPGVSCSKEGLWVPVQPHPSPLPAALHRALACAEAGDGRLCPWGTEPGARAWRLDGGALPGPRGAGAALQQIWRSSNSAGSDWTGAASSQGLSSCPRAPPARLSCTGRRGSACSGMAPSSKCSARLPG